MKVVSPANYKAFLEWMSRNGTEVTVSGRQTIEVVNASIAINDPLDRLIFDPGRKTNIGFAIAEFASLFAPGSSIAYYNQFITDYGRFSSSPTVHVGGYGPRLAGMHSLSKFNQINGVIAKLLEDRSSRQAVMTIYDGPTDLNADPRDVPCTLSLQFLVRDEKLDMIVTMRSSDAVWGLTYDIFQFTMLQEMVARQVGAGLGRFYLNAGSMHVYEQHWCLHDKLADKGYKLRMAEMPVEFGQREISKLLTALKMASTPHSFDAAMGVLMLGTYAQNLAYAARAIATRKTPDLAQAAADRIEDEALRFIVDQWVQA